MAQGSNYKVPFRRRREGKTDYKARLSLVSYDVSRLVVRLSNTTATVQVIDYAPEGDITQAAAISRELSKHDLEGKYEPHSFEEEIYKNWEEKGYFKPNGDKTKESYCIMTLEI